MTDVNKEKLKSDEENLNPESEKALIHSLNKFKIFVIIFAAFVLLYMTLHLLVFADKKSNSISKTTFTEAEKIFLENEIGITVPENAYISEAELENDNSNLKLWITGINNCESFIAENTEYIIDEYKSLNPEKYGASRYYSIIRDGETELLECYIYKNSSDENWTAYIIDNNINTDINSIF